MSVKDLPPIAFRLYRAACLVLGPLQMVLLYLAYYSFSLYFRFVDKEPLRRKFVIGTTETARLIHTLSEILPSNYSCVLDGNPFYKDKYDFGPYHVLLRPFIGPLKLAYLAHVADVFVYIQFTGFLVDRKFDFIFLKTLEKKIVTLFCGTDIRSFKLTKEFFDKEGEDTFVNYLRNSNSEVFESHIKRVAELADKYSDLIFNWKYDQIGYLKRQTLPWPYMVDINQLSYEFAAPENDECVVVLHAPSHNIMKATPLVRAAVKKLQLEGYKFEYVELSGVPNSKVLEELGRCHIVLQEFYALTPGILGVEALSKGCAVLMSAGPDKNPELPSESSEAWVVTRYWEIYDNLKNLLDNPSQIEDIAKKGREFVENNYSYEKAAEAYLETFREHEIISDQEFELYSGKSEAGEDSVQANNLG